MRAIRLNLYERVAGFFILFALLGALAIALSVAIKQGWFEPRVKYSSTFENAEGVHAGTSVKMSGLTVGSVREVELLSNNRVRVYFDVLKKFSDRVREDSKVSLVRPFIIGDRVLEISVGSDTAKVLAERGEIPSESTVDIMSLMSGRRTGQVLAQLTEVMSNLRSVLVAFTNRDRMNSIVRIFDHLEPLLSGMAEMSQEVVKISKQVNKDQNLGKVMSEVAILTHELNRILPALNQENPDMGEDLGKLTRALGRVTVEMDRSFSQVNADLPSTTARMVEALNEATILIKAMQKSMFMRGSVREVREEEAQRQPASKP